MFLLTKSKFWTLSLFKKSWNSILFSCCCHLCIRLCSNKWHGHSAHSSTQRSSSARWSEWRLQWSKKETHIPRKCKKENRALQSVVEDVIAGEELTLGPLQTWTEADLLIRGAESPGKRQAFWFVLPIRKSHTAGWSTPWPRKKTHVVHFNFMNDPLLSSPSTEITMKWSRATATSQNSSRINIAQKYFQ